MKRIEFERVTPENVGISSADILALIEALEGSGTEMHGIQIMRYGKICAEGWWAPYAPGLRHGLQSLTKTYAATAVGIAYTQGLLKLSDRVIDIFPEQAPAAPSENLLKLTVRDVLCMGSGMDEMPAPSKDWIRSFLATPVNHTPGTAFMYNSTGSSLLGAIVCKLAGTTLQQYLKDNLFDKIGIDADNIRWFTMPDGIEMGGGGMFATTEDNLRLMKLYADGGLWDGEPILAKDYVALATSRQIDSSSEEKVNPPAKDNFLGYGFQIWMCKPQGTYRADGAMGQFSIVCPDKDLIISINETAPGAHWAQSTLDLIWAFIEKIGPNPVLPENASEASRLKRSLACKAIASPAFAAYSPNRQKLHGFHFEVTEGTVSLDSRPFFMAGDKAQNTITAVSFAFDESGCDCVFTQQETSATIRIATDGSRSINRLGSKSQPMGIAAFSGAFTSDGSFEVRVRWVESCFERIVLFQPVSDDTLKITCKNKTGFIPNHDDSIHALARKK